MNPKQPFKWRHFQSDNQSAVRAVVLALSFELPPFGRDDAGTGTREWSTRQSIDGFKAMPPN